MVNCRKQTVTIGEGSVQERTAAAMHPILVITPLDSEQRILFPLEAGVISEKCGVVVDIVLDVNKALCATRIRKHIGLQRLT